MLAMLKFKQQQMRTTSVETTYPFAELVREPYLYVEQSKDRELLTGAVPKHHSKDQRGPVS